MLAVEVMLDIAWHVGRPPVQSGDIALRLGVRRRYLEPILQQLVRTGHLEGVRGPRGGYMPAKLLSCITLGDIARALAGEEGGGGLQSPLGTKVVGPLFQVIHDSTLRQLDEVTLETLCQQAKTQGISRPLEEPPDFSI